MRAKRILLLCALWLAVWGCGSARMLALAPGSPQFDTLTSYRNAAPAAASVVLKLSGRGLSGKLEGTIRKAEGAAFMTELSARGVVVLKFYHTPGQIIYWPSNAGPKIYSHAESPLLSELVDARLPHWRLSDLLPLPALSRERPPEGSADVRTSLNSARNGRVVQESIDRPNATGLRKRFSGERINDAFPFRRADLFEPDGRRILSWRLTRGR